MTAAEKRAALTAIDVTVAELLAAWPDANEAYIQRELLARIRTAVQALRDEVTAEARR